MPLDAATVLGAEGPIGPRVRALLSAAERYVERFVRAHRDTPIPAFVASDFARVYGVLRAIRAEGLASGSSFCEWGSGLGIVTCLASMVGFDAVGIEIEPALVDAAASFAERFSLPVQFVHGNLIPAGGESLTDSVGGSCWLETGGPDAYDELAMEVRDFDVIFAYPWPGEESVIESLFERFGAAGALLVTYRGLEGVTVQRKVTRRRRVNRRASGAGAC